MTGPWLPEEAIRFQLAWLTAYERLLGAGPWDEARLNEAIKTALSAWLPLLRSQRTLAAQLFAAHQELIGQYRRLLEAALEPRDGKP